MKKFAVCVLALLFVVACNKQDESFMGKSYSTNGEYGAEITMEFHATETRVFGKVVNRYNGSYTVAGNTIKFTPFASTMMMGPEDAMRDEYSFHQFMSKVDRFDINGDELIFYTPEDGSIILHINN